MVLAVRAETGQKHGSVQRVAAQLGIGAESLNSTIWVIPAGRRWALSASPSGCLLIDAGFGSLGSGSSCLAAIANNAAT